MTVAQFKFAVMLSALLVGIVLMFIIPALRSTCQEDAAYFKKIEWKFIIDKKYISSNHGRHMFVVLGKADNGIEIYESSGNLQKKLEVVTDGFANLYADASVGDSVYKAVGTLEIKLIRKDTTQSYFLECDGKVLK